ncbi:hypothetical protein H7I77_25185 [Mycolicibacterium novocastrense]|uniref:Uncharacterized protein n=1 Tax=Mycolicibacterium novocastrense TaxID=59813 RepID=A0AAW5SRT2_MYCNV|nr:MULTISPECIES: hypothetical protein [Mycolicibacterium]MCV7026606.1 hypothetical protein [Mycolicibacterium novocastrense]MDX1887478.1 hypothetical protein [Mycolicibacterium sp. 120270]
MEYLVTTPQGTYRIDQDADDVGDLIALLDHYATTGSVSGPAPLRALSRQQVLAQLGRATLPEDKETPFPAPAVVIGDEDSGGAFTRGWLDSQITAWQDQKMATKILGTDAQGPETADSQVTDQPAAESDQNQAQPATPTAVTTGEADRDDQGKPNFPKGTRQWEAPGAADERVVIVTSRGITTPSGWVLTGPLPAPQNVPRFVAWHWRKKPSALPQMWFTAEAMERIGIPVEDADPGTVAELVADIFGCKVSWSQSGFFTCRWGPGDDAGGAEGASVANRSVQLVFVPWLPLDPSEARSKDMGVAGIEDTETELPEDEDQAVPILAERIAWVASLGEGLAPASRWSTVGAAFADVVRRRSSIKGVKGCPWPGEIVAAQTDLDPDLHEGRLGAHKARGDTLKVEVDQRAAYLASAIKLNFGYGEPSRVDNPDPDVLNTQEPPFALWRVTTPPANTIDGLDQRLPLPVGYMATDEQRTFWTTTRGAQHLMSPVDQGGAGLTPAELAIDAAWVWPHQARLLRSWAEAIRVRLKAAIAEGRKDREDMLKAMYKAYLGRMQSSKWSPQQYHHHQPAWYAAIQADTRFRAMTYARHIVDTHGWYPVAADVDAWSYWLPPDADLTVLEEPSENNGKYRIKTVELPPAKS